MAGLFRRRLAAHLRRPHGPVGRRILGWLDRANAGINRRTLRLLDLSSGERLLEVGFGGGDLLEQALALGASVAGADFSPAAVAATEQRLHGAVAGGRCELVVAGATALPFPDGAFTAACAVNVLYFWPEPERVLREIRRVLAPGGRLVLAYNSPAGLASLGMGRAHGFRAYAPAEVERRLHEAGFGAVTTEAVDSEVTGEPYLLSRATRPTGS